MSTDPRLSPTGEFLNGLRRRPVNFVRGVLHETPCRWQRDALRELFGDEATGEEGCQKYLVQGCTTSGKDRWIAMGAWHVLGTMFGSKVIATAPNESTLDDNLFGEMGAIYEKSPLMQAMFEFETRRIRARGMLGRRWYMIGRVARAARTAGKDAVAEGLAGRYADDTLAIGDEASHPDMNPRIDALVGSSTSPRRRVVLIGNPLRPDGRFYEHAMVPQKMVGWKKRKVGYLDSPFTGGIDPDEVGRLSEGELAKRMGLRAIREEWRRVYGEDSAYYQARALGDFPTATTVNTIFAHLFVVEAQQRFGKWLRELDDPGLMLRVGIDVARFGDDECVWYYSRGNVSIAMEYAAKTDGPTISGRAIDTALRILRGEYTVEWTDPVTGRRERFNPPPHPLAMRPDFEPRRHVEFRIDEGGLAGLGPVDYMRAEGWAVAGVRNDAVVSPNFVGRYKNLGAELWMEDAVEWLKTGSLYPDEILASQLETRQYDFVGKADERMLESKDQMKTRGLGSPDRGDGYVLSVASSDKLDLGGFDLRRKIAFV